MEPKQVCGPVTEKTSYFSFWSFVAGVGSVMEIFPTPGRFDRWRMKEELPENEWAMLFDALLAIQSNEKKPSGAST